ncbi:hypothetical protein AKO1_012304 [Acrasis kona]|uniref:Uncharacterized protein n=1 Tax=Acrasis kona TaxID=1008807 RepID=A0AAW2YWW4_9EUKA
MKEVTNKGATMMNKEIKRGSSIDKRIKTNSCPTEKKRKRSDTTQSKTSSTFSHSDINYMVSLVLNESWPDVELCIQLLISYYEEFLEQECTSMITRTIVDQLYELLVGVKVEKYNQTLESNNDESAIHILMHEVPLLNKRYPVKQYKQMQVDFNDRQSLIASRKGNKQKSILAGQIKERLEAILEIHEQPMTRKAKSFLDSEKQPKKHKPPSNMSILVEASDIVIQKIESNKKALPIHVEDCNSRSTAGIKPTQKLCTGGITSTPALRERLIKILEQYHGLPVTWEDIQRKVSGNRAKVWATLCMFVNEGVVTQTGKGRRGQPYKYILNLRLTNELEKKFKEMDKESIELHQRYIDRRDNHSDGTSKDYYLSPISEHEPSLKMIVKKCT